MTELVRTRGGMVVHRASCRYAVSGHAVPWKWAEGRSHMEIRVRAAMVGVKLCKVCGPAQGAGVIGEVPA